VRVLFVHNDYLVSGGEETVLNLQLELLSEAGHSVAAYRRSSKELAAGLAGKVQAASATIFPGGAVRELTALIAEHRPDVVHVHNLYPLITGAVLPAIRHLEIPTVMTLHNYRLWCPVGTFFSRGELCERCRHGSTLSCVIRDCAGGFFKSITYAFRERIARSRGYFFQGVDLFLPLTRFQESLLQQSGVPDTRIRRVPNTVRIPEIGPGQKKDQYILFVGRHSLEKGYPVLMNAARLTPEIPFRTIGDLSEPASPPPENVTLLGRQSYEEVQKAFREAALLVVPSLWYEGMPMVILEAMAQETAVVVSEIGGLGEVCEASGGGVLVPPGDARALAATIRRLWNDRKGLRRLGYRGRSYVAKHHSPELYTNALLDAYRHAQALARWEGKRGSQT
jgi:glycosyltransferase involved in cell wall biosynthesis